MNKCSYDPSVITGAIGMFHCPECGEMVVAGIAHPDYSLLNMPHVYEIHPCISVGTDENGNVIMEQCEETNTNIFCWSLYEHFDGKGLEWIRDFHTKALAESYEKYLPH